MGSPCKKYRHAFLLITLQESFKYVNILVRSLLTHLLSVSLSVIQFTVQFIKIISASQVFKVTYLTCVSDMLFGQTLFSGTKFDVGFLLFVIGSFSGMEDSIYENVA